MADPRASSLRVTRVFDAPRERVFRAWTDPDQFARWFTNPGSTFTILEFDAREGGSYAVEGSYEGEVWRVDGTWREVRFPERLVFTWNSRLERAVPGRDGKAGKGSGDTVVTVDFFDRGGRTEIVLVHDGFTAEESRRAHDEGWKGCLDRIAGVVA